VIAQAGHQRADAVTDLALPARTNFMPRLRRAVNGYRPGRPRKKSRPAHRCRKGTN
jgi:hypothetical protein